MNSGGTKTAGNCDRGGRMPLGEALAVRNEEKGDAVYRSSRARRGSRLRRQRPGSPSRPVERALPRREERQLRRRDYFHCPSETHHVLVGAGDEPSVILMIGARPGAAAARETEDPDEAYADRPGDYVPLRLPWPL